MSDILGTRIQFDRGGPREGFWTPRCRPRAGQRPRRSTPSHVASSRPEPRLVSPDPGQGQIQDPCLQAADPPKHCCEMMSCARSIKSNRFVLDLQESRGSPGGDSPCASFRHRCECGDGDLLQRYREGEGCSSPFCHRCSKRWHKRRSPTQLCCRALEMRKIRWRFSLLPSRVLWSSNIVTLRAHAIDATFIAATYIAATYIDATFEF